MNTIYKNAEGKNKVLGLYEEQLNRIGAEYKELYIDTAYGKTHLIETGNPEGIPLLVFHGGNATTALTLLECKFLFADFHIYAVDTIGHPGKSAENSLSHKNYEYGLWAKEVITALGYSRMKCFGGSYGAGIIVKTMGVSPDKVEKAVIYVPSGIKNAPAYKMINMMFPMIMYWITKKDQWLRKCILPMALTEDNINPELYLTAKYSIDYVKIKTGMPSDALAEDMMKCLAPTLVMAGEHDCLFPAKLVLPQAKKIIPNCTTYLLQGRGHMNYLTEEEKQMIIDFLK